MPDGPPIAIGPGGVRLGLGAIDELGQEARGLGLGAVAVLTDAALHATDVPHRAVAALEAAGIWSETLVAPVTEPTDVVIEAVAQAASAGRFDGIVAVGGGSVIDIAKGVGLLRGSSGRLADYVNPPFGGGRPPDRAPLPLIAVPTTAGSGSECSPVAVLELSEQGVKTAISHPALRPVLAIADAGATVSLPRAATFAAALDVLAHALESLTCRPRRERPVGLPGARPGYVGANPYSSALCEAALAPLARGIAAVARDLRDLDARSDLMEASTLSALGAAVAGAHVGHACAYAIAGRVDRVPHGFAAAVVLPALMRHTYDHDPSAHVRFAKTLGGGIGANLDGLEPRERLPAVVTALLALAEAPSSLSELGLGERDVEPLADAALRQDRLMAGTPRGLGRDELTAILADAVRERAGSCLDVPKEVAPDRRSALRRGRR